MSIRPLQLRQLLERLVGAEVRFVLVGGLAVNAWGYLRGTEDIGLQALEAAHSPEPDEPDQSAEADPG